MIVGEQIKVVDITDKPVTINPKSQSGKIYVRSVLGPIETIRRYIGFVFLGIFALLPWVKYQGHQAILLDFAAQRFHLFGLTLWPQDLMIFAWIFIIGAFALFFATVVLGRVWCGFTCPQTVFTFLFVWIEERIEGTRNKRIHLDKQDMSLNKAGKKITKHGLWWLVSLLTSLTFVGYFTPVDKLFADVLSLDISTLSLGFVLFFAACTYANAGWMRELMCTHICPYSRFQSSMFDNDTLTVTYDRARGEGRGPRPRKMSQLEYNQKGLGDCIDCQLCVQVCPTGIDIRNGLQYECINCGKCIDACNDVMTKMGYRHNLISYTSQTETSGKKSKLIRPKVIGYFVVLVVILSAMVIDISTRKPLDIDLIRDRTSLYKETVDGDLENVYTLVIRNKSQKQQSFHIDIEGLAVKEIIGKRQVSVAGSELISYPISIIVDPSSLSSSVTQFNISVSNDDGDIVTEQITFLSY